MWCGMHVWCVCCVVGCVHVHGVCEWCVVVCVSSVCEQCVVIRVVCGDVSSVCE